jgi:hypothetical protein
MTHRYVLMLGAILFMSFPPSSYAGPCTEQISVMEAKIYAKINARSRPAEGELRDVSTKTAEATGDAMDRAREADLAGDKAACERALAEAQKAIDKL